MPSLTNESDREKDEEPASISDCASLSCRFVSPRCVHLREPRVHELNPRSSETEKQRVPNDNDDDDEDDDSMFLNNRFR
jgi:hypothetical protein